MSRVRIVVLAVVSGVVLAGCASSGEPDDYDAVVADNYSKGCLEANGDLPNAEFDVDSESFCECTYDFFVENVPYGQFKSLNNRLKSEAGDESFNEAQDLDVVLITLHEGLRVGNVPSVEFGALVDSCLAGEAPSVTGERTDTGVPGADDNEVEFDSDTSDASDDTSEG